MYKLLLHNDNNNRREYVVKVLLKVVDGLTMDDAINVMQVSAAAYTFYIAA
jgi:ATP-dependent Clp protease adaptor protein ClpS